MRIVLCHCIVGEKDKGEDDVGKEREYYKQWGRVMYLHYVMSLIAWPLGLTGGSAA
jgi:hypothetical protein